MNGNANINAIAIKLELRATYFYSSGTDYGYSLLSIQFFLSRSVFPLCAFWSWFTMLSSKSYYCCTFYSILHTANCTMHNAHYRLQTTNAKLLIFFFFLQYFYSSHFRVLLSICCVNDASFANSELSYEFGRPANQLHSKLLLINRMRC